MLIDGGREVLVTLETPLPLALIPDLIRAVRLVAERFGFTGIEIDANAEGGKQRLIGWPPGMQPELAQETGPHDCQDCLPIGISGQVARCSRCKRPYRLEQTVSRGLRWVGFTPETPAQGRRRGGKESS